MSGSVFSKEDIYSTRVDDASSTVTYVGKAYVGASESAAVWQIQRITVTGTVTDIKWADGNTKFDNSWNLRSSYAYS
jgi:hypothetical protein